MWAVILKMSELANSNYFWSQVVTNHSWKCKKEKEQKILRKGLFTAKSYILTRKSKPFACRNQGINPKWTVKDLSGIPREMIPHFCSVSFARYSPRPSIIIWNSRTLLFFFFFLLGESINHVEVFSSYLLLSLCLNDC